MQHLIARERRPSRHVDLIGRGQRAACDLCGYGERRRGRDGRRQLRRWRDGHDLGLINDYDGSAFADWDEVPSWAKPYIASLVEAGIVEDSREADGIYIFAENNVVREEMVAMAVRALDADIRESAAADAAAAAEAPDFGDVSGWAKGYMASALDNKMINVGDDRSVEPARNVRRDETAMILHELIFYLSIWLFYMVFRGSFTRYALCIDIARNMCHHIITELQIGREAVISWLKPRI